MAPKRSRESSEDSDDSTSSDADHNRSPQRLSPKATSSPATSRPPPQVTKPQLSPLLSCRLCIKPNDLLSRPLFVSPVTLPCGHSICSTHLKTLLPESPTTSNAVTIPCPIAGCLANVPPSSNKSTPPKFLGSSVTIYHPLRPRLKTQTGLRIESLNATKPDIKLESLLQLLDSAPEALTDDVSAGETAGRESPPPRPAKRPRTAVPSGRTFMKNLKEILSCEVCFMLYFEPLTLCCGHTFCAKCIQRTIDRDSKCPLCRSPLGLDICFALNLLDVEERQPPTNKVLVGTLLLAFGVEYISRRDSIRREAELAHTGGFDTPIYYFTECIFPGMRTRLTFSASDQRLMLRRVLSTPDARLGTVLASSALSPADEEPSTYGTLVGVKSVQFMPDNGAIAEVEGTPVRFRLLESRVVDGYTAARVERIEDLEDLDWTPPLTPIPIPLDHELQLTSIQPTVPEMMEFCRRFIEKMGTEAAPWVVKKYNDEYGPPPVDDPGAFGWWCASHLPILYQDKFKLLPIRSPRLRLQMLCYWISTLEQQWWYSRGCTIC